MKRIKKLARMIFWRVTITHTPTFLFLLFIVSSHIQNNAAEEHVLPSKHLIIPAESLIPVRMIAKGAAQDKSDHGENNDDIVVLFTAHDDMRARLVQYIAQEHAGILIAIYAFSDGSIAQAILDAHKRGVQVEVITDASCLSINGNKINLLQQAGIPVFVYKGEAVHGNTSGCMHHKFAIFKENGSQKQSLVWTGSLNFTSSACQRNHENVLVIARKSVVDCYENNFRDLKSSTYQLRSKKDESHQLLHSALSKKQVGKKQKAPLIYHDSTLC